LRAAPDRGADVARDAGIEDERVEFRQRAVIADVLDASGDLRLGGLAELEFVEDISCDATVVVRAPQAVERAAGIVGTWCGELLMPGLYADRCRQLREAQVERLERDLEPAFLLLVGEDLPHAIGREVQRIFQPDLAVLVVGEAA